MYKRQFFHGMTLQSAARMMRMADSFEFKRNTCHSGAPRGSLIHI
ncbi:hypothetical protein [Bosea sp. ASV33]|nr:hypothetical protein [Bosea sp. ASV33]